MKVLVLDLHRGEDLTETLKISNALDKYTKTSLLRLFFSDFPCKKLSSYDGIVLTGSDDIKIYNDPKVKELEHCLRELSTGRVNILGICGGNQVLASTFGYRRYRLREPEVGWHPIHLTERGKQDPLFNGLESGFMASEYHILAVICNDKNRILALNDNCPQAILYQPTVYGIQFHPEETPESGLEFLRKTRRYGKIAHTFSRPKKYVEWRIFKNFVAMTKKLRE